MEVGMVRDREDGEKAFGRLASVWDLTYNTGSWFPWRGEGGPRGV